MKKYTINNINDLDTVIGLKPPFQATIHVGMHTSAGQVFIGLGIKSEDILDKTINEIGEMAYLQYLKNIKTELES
ncbi:MULTISPECIES: hypothetical protein [Xenorhabdus]|uniref:hypothetical protein n=1 Tax=Xenorhabdus TaxID=626 RepID=UPI00064B706E|nr:MULTISPECIES: hypothetical protein [Xenorhabdus]KLU14266.1 hypothetical protein AAY47_17375 [Xenorhabdus griffiniae]KOP34777.1 hypothetical protein AFK69_02780 [Xenorhabdus sp. GDc328]